MMGRPLAWTALAKGTSILTSDGEEIGKVKDVVGDESKDIFSGLTYSAGLTGPDRFIPATLVEDISDEVVRIGISADETEKLEPYSA